MSDEERFFAWLDGELSGEEADEMVARVAADSKLSALADEDRALRETLRRAFDSIAQPPLQPRDDRAFGDDDRAEKTQGAGRYT